MIRSIITVLALFALIAPAVAEGDARSGAATARQWCAECHLVGSGPERSVVDGAPPFTAIAADPSKSDAYLRTWLFRPRRPMPKLELSRREIDDLVAYIASLRPE